MTVTTVGDRDESVAMGEIFRALGSAGFVVEVGETGCAALVRPPGLDISCLVTVGFADGADPGNVTHVLWSRGEPREGVVFEPLTRGHGAYTERCWLCTERLGNGARVQLLVIGPETADDRARHAAGLTYPALAVYHHAACLQGREPDGP